MTEQAFPLSWPDGWKRTPRHLVAQSRFHKMTTNYSSQPGGSNWKQKKPLTIAEATDHIIREVERLGGREVVLSTNLVLTTQGYPRSGQRKPDDCGAAIYFKLGGKPRVLACDKWDQVADNMVAIAKHIEALRGQERWGVGSVEQAFAGYAALPPPVDWRRTLGLHPASRSLEDAQAAYRHLSKSAHPDVPGGSTAKMAELNIAMEQAKKECS